MTHNPTNSNEQNLEFAVSQAVDGVLSETDQLALGHRLDEADARALFTDYQRINTLLRQHAELPDIDFDAFSERVSTALEREELFVPQPLKMPQVSGTNWTRRFAGVAAAILIGLAAWPFLPHGNPSRPKLENGEAVVAGPAMPAPRGSAEIQVQIGPSQELVSRGLAKGLDDAGKRTPKVVISSAENGNDVRPY
jgi:hypothetical protein